ncbi:hypothetical protein BY458DRAFT_500197 [Sporodiniella umbellata]|nr:hypothetical protein BY458DRAFT_500197 [Sporodiniella umbellata]
MRSCLVSIMSHLAEVAQISKLTETKSEHYFEYVKRALHKTFCSVHRYRHLFFFTRKRNLFFVFIAAVRIFLQFNNQRGSGAIQNAELLLYKILNFLNTVLYSLSLSPTKKTWNFLKAMEHPL